MRDLEVTIRNAIERATPYLQALNGAEPLKVLTGPQAPFDEQASYESGSWYLEHITDTPLGADYYKLVVFDMDGSRAATLKTATVFARDGHIYKKSGTGPPIYVAPMWEFRLQLTGQRI